MDLKGAQQAVIDVAGIALSILIILFPLSFLLNIPYPLMVVSTSSMKPTLERGDVVVVIPSRHVNTGDIVLLRLNGRYILHRVVNLVEANGTLGVITKGDANRVSDQQMAGIPYSPINEVKGKLFTVFGAPIRFPIIGLIPLKLRSWTIMLLSNTRNTAFFIAAIGFASALYLLLSEVKLGRVKANLRGKYSTLLAFLAIFYVALLFTNFRNSSITTFRVVVEPSCKAVGVLVGGGKVLSPGAKFTEVLNVSNKGLISTLAAVTVDRRVSAYIRFSQRILTLKPGEKRPVELVFEAPYCDERLTIKGKIYVWNIPLAQLLPDMVLYTMSKLQPAACFIALTGVVFGFFSIPLVILYFLIQYLTRDIRVRILRLIGSTYKLESLDRDRHGERGREVKAVKPRGKTVFEAVRLLESLNIARKPTGLGVGFAKILPIILLIIILNIALAFEYVSCPVDSSIGVVGITQSNYALNEYNWSRYYLDFIVLDFEIIPPGYSDVLLDNALRIVNYDDENALLSVDVDGEIEQFIDYIYSDSVLLWDGSPKLKANVGPGGEAYLDFYFSIPQDAQRRAYTGALTLNLSDAEGSEMMTTSIEMTLSVDKPFIRITYISYYASTFKWYIDRIINWWPYRIYIMHWSVIKRIDAENNGSLGLDSTILKDETPEEFNSGFYQVLLANSTTTVDVTSYIVVSGPVDSDGDGRLEWNLTLPDIPSTPWQKYLENGERSVYYFMFNSTYYVFITYFWQPPPDPDPILVLDDAWAAGRRWLRTVGVAESSWDYDYTAQWLDGPVDPPPLPLQSGGPQLLPFGAKPRREAIQIKPNIEVEYNAGILSVNVDGNSEIVCIMFNRSLNSTIKIVSCTPRATYVESIQIGNRTYDLLMLRSGEARLTVRVEGEISEVSVLLIRGCAFQHKTFNL